MLPVVCCLLLQVLLGLTDAGYSGDWSRIGAITKGASKQLQQQHSLQACPSTCASQCLPCCCCCAADTELLLQKFTLLAWALHGVTGLLAANISGSRGRSPAVAGAKVRTVLGRCCCCM